MHKRLCNFPVNRAFLRFMKFAKRTISLVIYVRPSVPLYIYIYIYIYMEQLGSHVTELREI